MALEVPRARPCVPVLLSHERRALRPDSNRRTLRTREGEKLYPKSLRRGVGVAPGRQTSKSASFVRH